MARGFYKSGNLAGLACQVTLVHQRFQILGEMMKSISQVDVYNSKQKKMVPEESIYRWGCHASPIIHCFMAEIMFFFFFLMGSNQPKTKKAIHIVSSA